MCRYLCFDKDEPYIAQEGRFILIPINKITLKCRKIWSILLPPKIHQQKALRIFAKSIPDYTLFTIPIYIMENYSKKLKQPAQNLRNTMTDAEKKLWQRLRKKQLLGMQFYRQKPLLNYIVDFYCPTAKLIIECDGQQHFTTEGLLADQIRDQTLSELGLVTLRFENHRIILDIDCVCQTIKQHILVFINQP